MPLTPLYIRLNAVDAIFFRLNSINAAFLLVQRRYRSYFASLTPLTPLSFRLDAANAAIYPVKRR